MIAAILVMILWAVGGWRITDYVPYYWKWVVGQTATVQIGPSVVHAEVAASQDAQIAGLSGRSYLPIDRGMLFTFATPGSYAFTMRGMEFPLDIIWINQGTIVHIAHRVPPGQETIDPGVTATEVLEVRSGTARGAGWRIGDSVAITFDKK